jgi:hypothetical protein
VVREEGDRRSVASWSYPDDHTQQRGYPVFGYHNNTTSTASPDKETNEEFTARMSDAIKTLATITRGIHAVDGERSERKLIISLDIGVQQLTKMCMGSYYFACSHPSLYYERDGQAVRAGVAWTKLWRRGDH